MYMHKMYSKIWRHVLGLPYKSQSYTGLLRAECVLTSSPATALPQTTNKPSQSNWTKPGGGRLWKGNTERYYTKTEIQWSFKWKDGEKRNQFCSFPIHKHKLEVGEYSGRERERLVV